MTNECIHHDHRRLACAEWEKRGDNMLHCSYCGSISTADVLVLLTTSGVDYCGSDWKYRWPHKFYFGSPLYGHLKFYARHLMDATEDQFVLFNRLAEDTLGITYERIMGDTRANSSLSYHALVAGYQAAGTIGGEKRI